MRCFCTVKNDGSPDFEPVLDVRSYVSVNPVVDIVGRFTNEEAAISGKDVVAFGMQMAENNGSMIVTFLVSSG